MGIFSMGYDPMNQTTSKGKKFMEFQSYKSKEPYSLIKYIKEKINIYNIKSILSYIIKKKIYM
jgi:hypothetical protein